MTFNVQMTLSQQQVPPEPWYASGAVWTIIGVVVTVLLGSWTVWAAFRSARPRRTLYVWVDSVLPLVNTTPGLHGHQLIVTLDGKALDSPYVVKVEVASQGSLDISATAFGGQPLELEFGVPIMALLEQSAAAGRPAVREPGVSTTDTRLRIGPALLTRRHRLRYIVLLDGEPKFRIFGDLENVDIRESRLVAHLSKRSLYLALLGLSMMILGLTLISTSDPGKSVTAAVVVYITGAIFVVPYFTIRLRRIIRRANSNANR